MPGPIGTSCIASTKVCGSVGAAQLLRRFCPCFTTRKEQSIPGDWSSSILHRTASVSGSGTPRHKSANTALSIASRASNSFGSPVLDFDLSSTFVKSISFPPLGKSSNRPGIKRSQCNRLQKSASFCVPCFDGLGKASVVCLTASFLTEAAWPALQLHDWPGIEDSLISEGVKRLWEAHLSMKDHQW